MSRRFFICLQFDTSLISDKGACYQIYEKLGFIAVFWNFFWSTVYQSTFVL